MSIRPIDLQVVVQRTQEIHAAKQSVVNKLDNEQQRMQDQTNITRIRQQQAVQKTQTLEHKRVDSKSREQSNDQTPSKRRKKQQTDAPEDESLDPRGRRFDVRL